MAFTLKIKAKALLGPKKTDIDALLKSCGMAYGSANEFYILEEGESNQGTAVLYNPAKLGRGIFIGLNSIARRRKEITLFPVFKTIGKI